MKDSFDTFSFSVRASVLASCWAAALELPEADPSVTRPSRSGHLCLVEGMEQRRHRAAAR